MEDAKISYLSTESHPYIFGVFDGHGGFQVSKFIERTFKDTFLQSAGFKQNNIKNALYQTFMNLDSMLLNPENKHIIKSIRQERKLNSDQIPEGGSTANVVVISKNKIYCANAGDSRSVLSRGGKAIPLSSDHKPENKIERDRIQKAGGVINDGRVDGGLNLSRAVGDFSYKGNKQLSKTQQKITCQPDITETDRSSQDQFIIIGCDGIWQKYVQNNQGMIDLINSKKKKQFQFTKDAKICVKLNGEQYKDLDSNIQMLKQIFQNFVARSTAEIEGCDNMTCQLIQFLK